MESRVIVITGCTGGGKGKVGRSLARNIGGEILSIDSMKVYRGMDIGTAKPSAEERTDPPHHLIDVADPSEDFSAARFVDAADAAVREIHARGKPVVAVGGTILYLKCWYHGLFDGPSADEAFRNRLRERFENEGADALHAELSRVDPAAAERIHRNDIRRIERALEVFELTGRPITAMQQQWAETGLRRPEWNWRVIGVRREKEAASRRINDRVRRMVASGLEEEAHRLWSDSRGLSRAARQAVGYAEFFDFFENRRTREEAIEKIKIHSRHLAKHQRTWLRRFGDVQWVDVVDEDTVESVLGRVQAMLFEGNQ